MPIPTTTGAASRQTVADDAPLIGWCWADTVDVGGSSRGDTWCATQISAGHVACGRLTHERSGPVFGSLRVPAAHPPTEMLAPSPSWSLPRSGSRKTISRRSASHRIASSLQTKVSGPPRRSSSVVHSSPILSTPGPAPSSSPGPSFTTARGPRSAARLAEGRHRTPMATRQDRASKARMGRGSPSARRPTRSVLSSMVMATCTFSSHGWASKNTRPR